MDPSDLITQFPSTVLLLKPLSPYELKPEALKPNAASPLLAPSSQPKHPVPTDEKIKMLLKINPF